MKYFRWSIVCMVLIAASCAGLPRPEGPDDALIVGNLVLDFPDGFFTLPARSVGSHVDIIVENRTKGTKFAVSTTAGGFFSFLSNGADSYSLTSFSYVTDESRGRYTVNGKLGIDLTAAPRQVLYLGHITYRYTLPPEAKQQQYQHETRWQFAVDATKDFRAEAVREYLRSVEPDTPWLSYEFGT